jgi:L-threonylcarbamoyladenylate synthase
VLREGGILAHPTETVYGIGGAAIAEVDADLDRLKGRDRSPVLRIAGSISVLKASLPEAEWTPEAMRLAGTFWPGPITLVLPLRGGGSVAVRVEGHPVTREVLRAWGGIIGSTSLNLSGGAAARTFREAERVLREMPDIGRPVLLLDAGDLPGPPPSTLVALTGEAPVILREGAVSSGSIRSCIAAGDTP